MKLILSALMILAFTPAFASAAPAKSESDKVCETLENKMDDECAHIVCDSGIKAGDWKDLNDCTTASDYAEAAQGICDDQPTLEDVVKQYNQEHVNAHLECQY